jgi:hypothetical protein
MGKVKNLQYKLVCFVLVAAALVITGCTPAKFSGKGQLASTSGAAGEKAQFKFKADTCNPDKTKSKFEYSDKTAAEFPNGGVKLEGEMLGVAVCGPGTATDCSCPGLDASPAGTTYLTIIRYVSTNPVYPGNGYAAACFQDNGKKKNGAVADQMAIAMFPKGEIQDSLPNGEIYQPGPYAYYVNMKPLEKGDIKAGHCKDPKEPEMEIYSTKDKDDDKEKTKQKEKGKDKD